MEDVLKVAAYGIYLVPVIVALVAALVGMGIPKGAAPALALILGVAAGFVYVAPHDPREAALVGISLGLMSIGGHSGTKNTYEALAHKK